MGRGCRTYSKPGCPILTARFSGRLEWELRLCDFSALDAARAHAQPLGRAIHQHLHRLQIHVPPAARQIVRMRNVIAEARPFTADIANLCHRPTPNLSVFSGGRGAYSQARHHLAESSVYQSLPPAISHHAPASGTRMWASYRAPPAPKWLSYSTISCAVNCVKVSWLRTLRFTSRNSIPRPCPFARASVMCG